MSKRKATTVVEEEPAAVQADPEPVTQPKAKAKAKAKRQAAPPVEAAPEAAAAPAADGDKKKKKKKKKKAKKRDANKLTKPMIKAYKFINGAAVDRRKGYRIAHSTFARKLRDELWKQRTLMSPRPVRLTYQKGVTRRAQLMCSARFCMIATIAARALDEFGLKKCSLSNLHMARDIYNMCKEGGLVNFRWYDRSAAKYKRALAKYRDTREKNKVAGH
jgi:hypothetical protein